MANEEAVRLLAKLDRVYKATAEKLAKFKAESPQAAGEFSELAWELAQEYARLDAGFIESEFLNVADPD